MFKQMAKPFQHKKVPLDNSIKGKNKQKVKDWRGTVKRLWGYLAENRNKLFLILFMVFISSFLALLGPFLVGMTIDEYIVTNENSDIIKLLLALGIIYVFLSLTKWLQSYWMVRVAQNTVHLLRTQLFSKLHKLPISFFDQRQQGELMSRVTNDIENVSSTLNSSVIQVFTSIITLVGIVIVMLWLSPLLTLITMAIIPLMFLGMKWITKRTGKLFKEQQKNLGELNGFIEETISGQRIIKTFSKEKMVLSDFLVKNERLKESGFWSQTYSGFIPKLMNILNNLSFAFIAGVGGVLAIQGIVSIGVMVIFAEYARQFTRPLNDLANQFNTILSAIAGAERVFEVIDEENEETDTDELIDVREIIGEVEFQHVGFSYDKQIDTIKDVSFFASPGETIALVGPTGAGKTSMINLLSRFYDSDEGKILIDGTDITSIKRESLRSHIGFVLQDSFLFEGTIRENIRYGKLEASDKEVEDAAQLANAHSFIMKLPNQYDTVLHQDGGGISQGQKQLLSIARALIANPSILILDEATSTIDTVTEVKIQQALKQLLKGRTSFVIAHRLNTIQQAEQILVLENGVIIERGNHETLLQKKGFYYDLHHSQFMKEISS
ncbi:ABC transporter ATP-binding protein [Bacillus sp. FJAT-45350]|uniref:ABC transporter ATP-binding protein n=1 Tax=Bacillus sp. FJAT-45350 TaxID=2011014 RepID=UPI000BB7EB5B|nr:ABC transporter ATP-binding protein [Bacillus sp. FJAT-45350]